MMSHASADLFLNTADRIAAKLCRDAIWAEDRCNWLGSSVTYVEQKHQVLHHILGPDVYGGTSGIALFLAKAFQQTNDRIFRLTAEGGLRQALSRLDDVLPQVSISFYSGVLGIAFVAIELGEITGNQGFVQEGLALARSCVEHALDVQLLDVIAGSASGIPTLLRLYQRYHEDIFLDLAIRHGNHLLQHADQDPLGWSWPTTAPSEASRNLTGYGHGTAGIGIALLELYAVTHETTFQHAAVQAFNYERHWLNREEGNYPDFRLSPQMGGPPREAVSYMTAWCHGAPGIGISRVRAYQLFPEAVDREEMELTLQTTMYNVTQLRGRPQNNYSLCHGLGGNASLLLYAAKVLQQDTYRQVAEEAGTSGIEQYPGDRVPWACGILRGGETPTLMLGTAGIGYFYLGLYNNSCLPPILIIP